MRRVRPCPATLSGLRRRRASGGLWRRIGPAAGILADRSLAGRHGCRGGCRIRRGTRRRLRRMGRLMRLVRVRCGIVRVGGNLGRRRGPRRPAGGIGVIRRCGRLGGLAIGLQIPALGLFGRIGSVMPMAAGRRLSGRRCEAVILILCLGSVLRANQPSAHTGSGNNEQSTQSETPSCLRQIPLAFHATASPNNRRPASLNAPVVLPVHKT